MNKTKFTFGLLGECYAVRHELGHYRSVCVAARYWASFSGDSSSVECLWTRVENSLQATILSHSGLSYGLVNHEGSSLPVFEQLKSIQKDHVATFLETKTYETGQPPERQFQQAIEGAHSDTWVPNRPAWRTIILLHRYPVLPPDQSAKVGINQTMIYVAFVAHHAIADGLSGLAFHTSLMKNLSTAPGRSQVAVWPIILRGDLSAPQLVDDTIDFLATRPSHTHKLEDEGEDVWGGSVVYLPSVEDFRSRIRLITLTHDEMSRVMKTCRDIGVSATNLLHGLICVTLARMLGDIPGVRAVMPYSLRRFTGASPREVINHISYTTTYVPGSTLGMIRDATAHSDTEREPMVEVAKSFGRDMKTELERFPEGTLGENSGALEISAPIAEISSVTLEKLIFTQSGMVAGPAIGFNCMSVQAQRSLIEALMWVPTAYRTSGAEDIRRERHTASIDDRQIDVNSDLRDHSFLGEMAQHVEFGLFQMGGATLHAPVSDPNTTPNISESAIIARATSVEEILEVLKGDVYVRAKVWDFEKI
ncbi:hypothetical protein CSAL01_01316 [Colletotrichum salicis]|uniref:Alcohol acetyltransferase n=1 Tax=Colletotrichum salicis TaxID=1209931 RepID=A0A135UUI8_9PEZI|nr:hypothetical protein CSAL01_01316 [Colletotrichum salicis]